MSIDKLRKEVDQLRSDIQRLQQKINWHSAQLGVDVTYTADAKTVYVIVMELGSEGRRGKIQYDKAVDLSVCDEETLTVAQEDLLGVKRQLQEILNNPPHQEKINCDVFMAADPHAGGIMREKRGVNI